MAIGAFAPTYSYNYKYNNKCHHTPAKPYHTLTLNRDPQGTMVM